MLFCTVRESHFSFEVSKFRGSDRITQRCSFFPIFGSLFCGTDTGSERTLAYTVYGSRLFHCCEHWSMWTDCKYEILALVNRFELVWPISQFFLVTKQRSMTVLISFSIILRYTQVDMGTDTDTVDMAVTHPYRSVSAQRPCIQGVFHARFGKRQILWLWNVEFALSKFGHTWPKQTVKNTQNWLPFWFCYKENISFVLFPTLLVKKPQK